MLTEAAILRGPGLPPEIGEVELEPPREGEVLVRMVGAGVCHTDLSVAEAGAPGGHPAILGHEGSGIVEAVGGGSGSRLERGDRVVLTYASCGGCASCAAGQPAYCADSERLNFSGRRPDGSTAVSLDGEPVAAHFFAQSCFARHAIALERNAIRVPADVDPEPLGPLGCSVQTGAGTVLSALGVERGESVAIFGAGAVGLSAVMAAALCGAEPIIVVEPRPERRELALELGASEALDSAQEVPSIPSAINALCPGGVRFSIDTVSSSRVLGQAIASLAVGGTCATLGLTAGPNEVAIDQRRLLFGRTLRGVIEGETRPEEFIPRLVELWREGRLPFDRMLRRYPFAEIGRALEDARTGAAIKPLLTFAARGDDEGADDGGVEVLGR